MTAPTSASHEFNDHVVSVEYAFGGYSGGYWCGPRRTSCVRAKHTHGSPERASECAHDLMDGHVCEEPLADAVPVPAEFRPTGKDNP